jgi:N-methylhydantoinase A
MEKTRREIPSVEEFAAGIIQLAEAEMEKAIRLISVERGHDPREFTLVAFGGAGPSHACSLARTLGIPRVLVPAMPGALSAFGILGADVVRDYSRTVMISTGSKAFNRRERRDVAEDAEEIPQGTSAIDEDGFSLLEQHFAELEAKGAAEFNNEGLSGISIRSADLRYAGQGYEINVPAGPGMLTMFHDAHRKRYGHADEDRRVDMVNVRVRMVSASEPINLPKQSPGVPGGNHAVLKNKKVMFANEWLETPVFDRNLLLPDNSFLGPAIVHEYSATTVVPPECHAKVDSYSNLIIEVPADESH